MLLHCCGRNCAKGMELPSCGKGWEQNLSDLWRCTCGKKLLDPHQPVKLNLDISVHIAPALEEFLFGFVCYCKKWMILLQAVVKKAPEPRFVGRN